MSTAPSPRPLVVLMPIYDDWESAVVVVDRVHGVLSGAGHRADFLLVDDGSTTEPPGIVRVAAAGPRPSVRVLRLRRNLGHQRAIAIGLSHVQSEGKARAVVVMDGDGEDTPEGVLSLVTKLDETGGRSVIFGARARRTEAFWFRAFYVLFQLTYRALVGRGVRVGNFSVVPAPLLDRLVAVSELWNHYSASIVKARLPHVLVPIDRGHRIAGRSRMNLVSLLVHGLSAVSVYSDVIGLRMLAATFVLAVVTLLALGAVVGIRLFTDFAIPGWATTAAGMLVVILLQAILSMTVFVFITLQGRSALGFLPVRDFSHFVDRVDELTVND